jgi:hypothetical protein
MNLPENQKPVRGKRKEWILAIPLFLVLCVAVHFVITTSPFGKMSTDKQGFRVNDYEYKLQVIRSFWYGEIASIYKFDFQKAAIEGGFGVKLVEAAPIGDTPNVLLLFLPFSLVAKFGLPFAITLWVSVSLVVLFFALEKAREFFPDGEILSPLYFIVVCMFTFSYAMMHALSMGQTTLLACGILILIVLEITRAADDNRSPRSWTVIAAGLVLSVKIPYLVFLLGILFFFGYFREAISTCAAVVGAIVILGLGKGFGSILDWFEQIRLFSGGTVPEYYASSFNLHTQITFRSAFAQYTDSPFAVDASYLVLCAGLSGLLLAGTAKYMNPASLREWPVRHSPQRLATGLIGLLLLFLPYIGGYEDLLLLVPYLFVFLNADRRPRIGNLDPKFVLAILCTAVVLNYNLFPRPQAIFLFFLLKFIAIGCLFLLLP